MTKNVLIYSIPFGFGPAGKAIILANHLKKNYNVRIATFSHSLHLLKKSTNGISIFDCYSRNINEWDIALFDGVDTFISIMDLQVIRSVKIKYPHIKTIFVDSLFSWRMNESLGSLIEDIRFVDFYIAQYFPRIKNQFSTEKTFKNIYIVSPLIDRYCNFVNENKTNNNLLIHYGGVSSPIINFRQLLPFLEKTTETIIREFHKKIPLFFAGNIELMKHLKIVFSEFSDVVFDCFEHNKFQKILSQSQVFITTPGVESAYESFFWEKPILFLPPINSTQLHQVGEFLDLGCLSTLTNLDIEELQNIDKKSIDYIQKTLDLCEFCNRISARQKYADIIVSNIYALTSSQEAIQRALDIQEVIVPIDLEDGLCLVEKIIDC
jgi:hypothetical protein